MIKKRSLTNGVQANLSLEPSAASQSTSNINNNIIINKREDGKEDIVITRDAEVVQVEEHKSLDVRNVILEAYAQILLSQDKALLSNLISKNCIIVPVESIVDIIKAIINAKEVEVRMNEDISCCGKINPIHKIEAIKIINDNGEMITDFKNVYNKEYNDLINKYHLCLKYCIY